MAMDILSQAEIDALLRDEQLALLRLLKHRGLLDEEFNPDPVEDAK